ncbi:hypothetical protein [Geodermatophilus sp. DSM 44513]|uniref:hypothetical protein n=1 Tax=Geodermatophilus sp. DSM 44513 TaxID=1528104 RepID=UPI00127958BD|nr:hypothetical protein [Geodermatophilus sp. DSM 44513]WNV77211.1 hypothetical protein RTG05_08045 [Geodermatophilus sp. DSM 44513]
MGDAASTWLTVYGVAVVVVCISLAAGGWWGWALALFLLSFVVDALVVFAVRRARRRTE